MHLEAVRRMYALSYRLNQNQEEKNRAIKTYIGAEFNTYLRAP